MRKEWSPDPDGYIEELQESVKKLKGTLKSVRTKLRAARSLPAKWRKDAQRGAIGGYTGPLLAAELEAALRMRARS